MVEIAPDRIGKLALLLAMSSREEEDEIKAYVKESFPNLTAGVTFLTGKRSDVMKNVGKAAFGCVSQNNVIKVDSRGVHAVMHAALEALSGITNHILTDTSLKLKLSVVSDKKWIAIALYGDSAIHPLTNHERAGLGIMSLN